MGNLLCKKNKGDSPISPVDRVIGRCAQICPQNIGKKKHFWDKQVLETSPPPLSQQPKLGSVLKGTEQTGWETATLTVPDTAGNGTVPPVAPPRKKRPSMSPKKEISKKAEQDMKKDCKENTNEKIESTKVAITNPEIDRPPNSPEVSDSREDSSSPTKTISSIGNKKSDKFFGEQISDDMSSEEDLSPDEEKKQVQTVDVDKSSFDKDEVDYIKNLEPDKIPETEISEETEVLLRNINKETGILIFALEKQVNKTESSEYEGQNPVVEEIIVPVKRKPRHICDDEDCLRKLLHKSPSPDSAAPKKPQRDFTKYKKSIENFKSQEVSDSSQNQKSTDKEAETISTQQDTKNVLSEEKDITNEIETSKTEVSADKSDLLKGSHEEVTSETETIPADEAEKEPPPPIPPKLKKKSGTPPVPVRNVSENSEKTKRKSESVPPNMSNSEKILRRCLSSQSYLTPELVDKIAEQANSLSLSALYLPEDYSTLCNDGSGLVSPNYKLTEKRKLSSQISTTSQAKSDDGRASESDTGNEKQNEKSEKIDFVETQIVVINEQPKDTAIIGEPQKSVIHENLSEPVQVNHQQNEHIEDEKNQTSTSDAAEVQTERKIKKRVSVNSSSPEDISKTIQSFISKNDLTPKTVLKLLEDEFGELLHSKNLPPEDKRTIEELRKSATSNQNLFIQKNDTTKVESSPKQIDSETEVETSQSKAATLESNAKLTKSNHYSKIPKLKNKALDALASGEKRRHSIDELESWFSPKSDNVEDIGEVKRRRESSLPNCLDSPDADNKPQFSIDVSKSETKKTAESTNEHSSLLKFLEKEKSNY